MIASVRGLLVLVAIACVLALVVVVAPVRTATTESIDHAVVPHFDSTRINTLTLAHRGRPDIHLTRDAQRRWAKPKSVDLFDQHAIEAMLASLRGARWHRRGDRARAGAIYTKLTLDDYTIALGAPITGADQQWIVVDGTAMLVDGWVGRALDPDLLALRDRTPLADAGAAGLIELRWLVPPNDAPPGTFVPKPRPKHVLNLAGRPLRTRAGRIAQELVAGLVHALEHLTYVQLPDAAISGDGTVEIVTNFAVEIDVGGPCPGAPNLVAVRFTGGDGCIEPAAWHEVLDAAAAIDQPPEQMLDRRPALPANELSRIAIDTTTIELAKRPRLVTGTQARDADPDRVAELVAALSEPAEVVPLPTTPPVGTITITPLEGDVATLDLFAGGVLARHGEARALRPSPAAWAILTRPVDTLADPTRWLEDPNTVSSIAIDGTTYTRGAVLGEWSPRSADPALLEALAIATSQVRAPSHALPPTFAPLHRVTVTLTPPVGAPSQHLIELGAPGPDGCLARIDAVGVLAPLSLCTAAYALK